MMRTAHFVVALATTVCLLGARADGQSRPSGPEPLDHVMSPTERTDAAGQALTPQQRAALFLWLTAHLSASAPEVSRCAEDAIETRIDGDFDGWVGDTIFRLANGQWWQQTNPSAHYLFAVAPRVFISPVPHRMKVEGLETQISVRRIR